VQDDTILELRDIAHNFGGFRALDGVELSVRRGAICGLIGPNGSGKTTLFNVATGYIQPTQGDVIFNRSDMRPLAVAQRSRAGLVRTFQTPKVFDGMTVLQNVMAGRSRLARTSLLTDLLRTRHARAQYETMCSVAESVCQEFELSRLMHSPATKLTAGQRRIVELARAVACEPELLLLDEPSSGLSAEETDRLKDAIRALKARGISVLLVSHDMGLMSVAETVSVLYFGRIIARGTMDEVRQDEQVRQVYLGGAKC
jgi:branched-chain amino acid transport system ATP-binding protein/nonpolar-amino-acid-transporting ATPase